VASSGTVSGKVSPEMFFTKTCMVDVGSTELDRELEPDESILIMRLRSVVVRCLVMPR
jgi:hypothetical protein